MTKYETDVTGMESFTICTITVMDVNGTANDIPNVMYTTITITVSYSIENDNHCHLVIDPTISTTYNRNDNIQQCIAQEIYSFVWMKHFKSECKDT